MANPIAFYDEAIHEKTCKKVEIASQMHAALANWPISVLWNGRKNEKELAGK